MLWNIFKEYTFFHQLYTQKFNYIFFFSFNLHKNTAQTNDRLTIPGLFTLDLSKMKLFCCCSHNRPNQPTVSSLSIFLFRSLLWTLFIFVYSSLSSHSCVVVVVVVVSQLTNQPFVTQRCIRKVVDVDLFVIFVTND